MPFESRWSAGAGGRLARNLVAKFFHGQPRENEKGEEIAAKKQMIMNIVIYKFMNAAVAIAVTAASSRRSP